MDWKKIGQVVAGKGLSLLGGVLAGPQGAKIGEIVSNRLGLTEESEIIHQIETDPNTLLALRQLENDHQKVLIELALREEAARLADVQSARQMAVAQTQATGKRDINLYVLAWVVVVGFFALTALLMLYPIPAASNNIVMLLFGGLVTAFSQVLGYFFGSSKSSADKTAILANNRNTS